MQYLSLGINALSGELPVELGKLTNLISLCQAFLGGSMICFGKISLRNVKVKMCLMQEILLYVSFYIHHSIFTDGDKSSWKLDAPSNIDSTVYPLLTLFKLLKTKPFQKAEFTPEELDSRKRSLNLHDVMRELKSCLKCDEAFQYAQYVLRWEQIPADKRAHLMREKQEEYVSMLCSKFLSLKTKAQRTLVSSSPSGPAYTVENSAHQASDRPLAQLYD